MTWFYTNRPCVQNGSRLFLMEEPPKDRLRCTVNGREASAFPDTGSDLMVVSGDFARRNTFVVHREEKYRRQVELIDGSTILIDGMVLNAKLQFDALPASAWLDSEEYFEHIKRMSWLMNEKSGETHKATFLCDLHVVENLPCGIILSGDFTFRYQVFSRFDHLFYSEPAGPLLHTDNMMRNGILFMRNIKNFLWFERRPRTRGQTHTTPTQSISTWDDAWEIEETRRNQAQLWIATLPDSQRSIEETSENQKQITWDRQNPRPPQTRLLTSGPTLRQRAAPGVSAT
ncbi:hypothetical protein K445DRAFT_318428 [Daldinia sp. EC12]|nr:hypothetical protein K445DRAFT_318428 [Daldinia sp. EC12]